MSEDLSTKPELSENNEKKDEIQAEVTVKDYAQT